MPILVLLSQNAQSDEKVILSRWTIRFVIYIAFPGMCLFQLLRPLLLLLSGLLVFVALGATTIIYASAGHSCKKSPGIFDRQMITVFLFLKLNFCLDAPDRVHSGCLRSSHFCIVLHYKINTNVSQCSLHTRSVALTCFNAAVMPVPLQQHGSV